MVPTYKRPANEKSGIPVYPPNATTYQQLMQLQQPFVPVSCEYSSIPSYASSAVTAAAATNSLYANATAASNQASSLMSIAAAHGASSTVNSHPQSHHNSAASSLITSSASSASGGSHNASGPMIDTTPTSSSVATSNSFSTKVYYNAASLVSAAATAKPNATIPSNSPSAVGALGGPRGTKPNATTTSTASTMTGAEGCACDESVDAQTDVETHNDNNATTAHEPSHDDNNNDNNEAQVAAVRPAVTYTTAPVTSLKRDSSELTHPKAAPQQSTPVSLYKTYNAMLASKQPAVVTSVAQQQPTVSVASADYLNQQQLHFTNALMQQHYSNQLALAQQNAALFTDPQAAAHMAKEVTQKKYANALKLAAAAAAAKQPLQSYASPAQVQQMNQKQHMVTAAALYSHHQHQQHAAQVQQSRLPQAAMPPHLAALNRPVQYMRPQYYSPQQAAAAALALNQHQHGAFLYPGQAMAQPQAPAGYPYAINVPHTAPHHNQLSSSMLPHAQVAPAPSTAAQAPGQAVVLNPFKKMKTS